MELNKQSFKHPSFIIALTATIATMALYLLGNPAISGTPLNWHHIPEVAAIFFCGQWIAQMKFKPIEIFVVFASGVISALAILHISVLAVAVALAFSAPLLLGYALGKKQSWSKITI